MVSALDMSPLRSMMTANRSPILKTADGTSSNNFIQPAEIKKVVLGFTEISEVLPKQGLRQAF